MHSRSAMGHRQPRDRALVRREAQHLAHRADLRHDVAVRELDALGRARRAGRVDEGRQVVGADLGADRLQVEVRGRGGRQLVGEDDDLERRETALAHGERALEERRLGHEHAAAGVGDDVLGLLDGERRIDGERRGAQVGRGGVGDMELGSVGEPQRNGVAVADAQAGQAGGGGAHAVGVLAPGPSGGPVGGAQSRLVGVRGSRRRERFAQGGRRCHRGSPCVQRESSSAIAR